MCIPQEATLNQTVGCVIQAGHRLLVQLIVQVVRLADTQVVASTQARFGVTTVGHRMAIATKSRTVANLVQSCSEEKQKATCAPPAVVVVVPSTTRGITLRGATEGAARTRPISPAVAQATIGMAQQAPVLTTSAPGVIITALESPAVLRVLLDKFQLEMFAHAPTATPANTRTNRAKSPARPVQQVSTQVVMDPPGVRNVQLGVTAQEARSPQRVQAPVREDDMAMAGTPPVSVPGRARLVSTKTPQGRRRAKNVNGVVISRPLDPHLALHALPGHTLRTAQGMGPGRGATLPTTALRVLLAHTQPPEPHSILRASVEIVPLVSIALTLNRRPKARALHARQADGLAHMVHLQLRRALPAEPVAICRHRLALLQLLALTVQSGSIPHQEPDKHQGLYVSPVVQENTSSRLATMQQTAALAVRQASTARCKAAAQLRIVRLALQESI